MASSIKGLDGGSIGSDSSSPVDKIRVSTPVNSGNSGESTASPSTDSVQITASARTLASLAQAVGDTPDIDMNRVSALQQAISTGVYQISPEGIANKMLQLEQDLSSTKQQ